MKKTLLYSILFNKCPRCREGAFFVTSNPYDLKHTAELHEYCPVCGLKYLKEIGFFYGAMYVSYGLTVGLCLATYLLCHFLLGLSDTTSLITLSVLALLLWTVIFRKARVIWIHLFVKYDPSAKDRFKAHSH